MKVSSPVRITATFATAIPLLILPASAMSADDGLRSDSAPAPIQRPRDEPRWTDPVRDNDPILDESKWGPGDPSLTARQFHFTLPSLRGRDPIEPGSRSIGPGSRSIEPEAIDEPGQRAVIGAE